MTVILPAEGVNFCGCSALMRHSMAWPRISSLAGRMVLERLTGRDAQLGLDEVDAGDDFGHRMLNLDARVHLDEVELPVLIHEELDGAGILVADFGKAAAEGAADLFAHLRRDLQRRRFFDQLLVAALDGAFALEERNHVAMFVGQNLELDVARLLDELLHVEFAVAEGVGSLGKCGVEKIRAVHRRCGRCACRARRRRPWL